MKALCRHVKQNKSHPPAPPHPLLFRNRRPFLPLFAFSSSINDVGSYVLLSSYFFLGTHCGGRRCALPPAPPHPLLFRNRHPLLPTPIPFAFSIDINDLGSYALLPWYAAPSPLHPPTRFYFVTGAPCYLLLFLLLFPSTSTIWVPMCFFLRTSFLVAPPHPLSFCNRRPLLPTPIPFAFFISINDLGSYALLSWSALRVEALRAPPCTPPPAFISYPVPLATYSYSFCFFHQHQRFGFICASFFVLLSWYALRGEALRPPPCTPPPAFIL